MNTNIWKVGDVKITQVIEVEAGSVIQEVIPEATRENVKQIQWLTPHFADAEGNLKALVQAFVIETPDICAIIDTCVGNDKVRKDLPKWSKLHTDFLSQLAILRRPDSINIVLCTHLHFDHVGWNTMLVDDKWVPTFPRARYLFSKEEFEYWKGRPKSEIEDDHAGFIDSVLPVFEAGLVDLISVGQKVSNEISLIPTPGHTPAHVSVLIKSRGEQAVITGDAIHHPCQIARPEWSTTSDNNQSQARASRLALLQRFADTQTLIIGSHFAMPTAGLLQHDGNTFKLL